MKKGTAQSIIKHLFDISMGNCKIDDEMIMQEEDSDMQTILTGLLMLSEDIEYKREINQRNLIEKETLLKEIHHRVKNNLQVITSLLGLQASFIEDEETKGLFRYSQYRINSMAMIHELLYESDNLSKIDYNDYLNQLLMSLVKSMKGSDNNISIQLDVSDVNLNIDTAIPLGLMINEIITNAMKYGIKDDNPGELYLQIKKLNYPNFLLTIGDDGEGFPEEVNFRTVNSLGLKLIHRLSLQLRGSIEKDNSKKGTVYIIPFKEIEQTS